MSQTVEAVLWDVGGVFLPSPFSHIRAYGAELGMDGEELLELVFGPYHEDTDHPWHRLERGQMTFDAATPSSSPSPPRPGHDIDPMAVLMRMGGDGATIVREDVVAAAVAAKAEWASQPRSSPTTSRSSPRAGGASSATSTPMADVIIDSSAVGLRKPDPAIFRLALDQLGGIAPERSVFLDDAPGNIAAARSLGIHAILVEDDYAPAWPSWRTLLAA